MTHPHTQIFAKWNGKAGPECNIQYREIRDSRWHDLVAGSPTWNPHTKYRVKPTPTLRPWNYEELKAFFLSGKCILDKDGHIYRPTSVNTHGVLGTDKYCFKADELLNGFTQEDGSPCGTIDNT